MPVIYIDSGSVNRLVVTSSALVSGSFSVLSGFVYPRQNFTGSLLGTSSWSSTSVSASYVTGSIFVANNSVLSASYAISASHVLRYSSAGGFPFTGSALVTGSAGVTGSFFANASNQRLWFYGGAIITARCGLAGAGLQDSSLAFAGQNPSNLSCTEEYNGTSWTAGCSMVTSRAFLAGAGSQISGIGFGGFTSTAIECTEEYDGLSWTSVSILGLGRYALNGTGTQNEALAIGGRSNISTQTNCVEEYNGMSWSSGGNLITARRYMGAAGTQNEALAFGGIVGPDGGCTYCLCTEEYDGITNTWSSQNSMILARYAMASVGIQNDALAAGGFCVTVRSESEEYNGISWSSRPSLLQATNLAGDSGVANVASVFTGTTGTGVFTSCTQNYLENSTSLEISNCGVGTIILNSLRGLQYAQDSAAATAGVPLGALYLSGSVVKIRIV